MIELGWGRKNISSFEVASVPTKTLKAVDDKNKKSNSDFI
jgi:hypothetical protein